MNFLRWTDDRPDLRRPVMVLAFEGWNDAGDSASTAARHIADRFDASVFAQIDPEEFFDFSVTRPVVRLAGHGREIEWPVTDFFAAELPEHDYDLIVCVGHEPQLRWRTFANHVVEVAKAFDVSLVISLGALIAEVAHSRPITVFGSSQHVGVRDRLDLEPSTYEGPTGIVGVLTQTISESGIETVSLWGSVPNYVPHAPSPKAALALVNRVATLLDVRIPTGALEVGAQAYETQIDRLVADDDEIADYVQNLEREYDAAMSPDDLISDLEEFLRDQDEH